jgi:Protein of unknown function (DUF2997)
MDMQELEITIDIEGKVEVKVRGMHGQECLKTTENIENALGDVQERAFLPEYYEQAVVHCTCEKVNQE